MAQNPKSNSQGQKLPLFKQKGRPSILSTDDVNAFLKAVNAQRQMEVKINTFYPSDSSSTQSTGMFHLSDENSQLELNISLIPSVSGGGGGGGGTTMLGGYFKQSYLNYTLVTQNADGTGTLWRVAKRPILWALSSRTEYSIAETFTYPTRGSLASSANYGQVRVSAVSGEPNETQVIKPQFVAGDPIDFFPLATGLTVETLDHTDNGVALGTAIIYMELGQGRAWSQFYDQGATF